ncbi:HAD family hydrolase [Candidatus Epulonipiscium viviparus]|uniref:HAD family hydrolase n=1 Tax=Candidatus Epulonipiscium viviparus TaxID=420336 RepID=UPI002738149D|nr:HAD family hydrolase [Candidatus Epulopiscium viviparus]
MLIAKKDDIKLIVCDLDGTLLNNQNEISDRTKRALLDCRAQGINLCFASGRSQNMLDLYENILGGCDYVISQNGAIITKGRDTLWKIPIQPAPAAQVFDYIKSRQLQFIIYTANKVYLTANSPKLLQRFSNYTALALKHNFVAHFDLTELEHNHPWPAIADTFKIIVAEEDHEKARDYFDFIAQTVGVCAESTGYGLVGVFDKTVSKKVAVLKVLADLNLTADNVCIFGDYDNDLSMFDCATHKIAMGNAQQVLKDVATFVTYTNDNDGVAKYLELLLENY